MSNSIHLWTAIAILLMVVVITLMDWVPTPLNRNIAGMTAKARLPSTLVHGALGIFFAIANLLVWKWWAAYFAGIYPGEITPEIYAKEYAQNLTILPHYRGNPVIPDV